MSVNTVSNNAMRAMQPAAQLSAKSDTGNPFTRMSETELANHLSVHFDRFTDPKQPGVITRQSLENIAYSSTQSGVSIEDSQFARALLGNHGLMDKLDRYGNTKYDGKIKRESVRMVASPEHQKFSVMSNKDMANHLIAHFDTFKEHPDTFNASKSMQGVTLWSLEDVALSQASPPEAKMFARELLARPELLDQLGLADRGSRVTKQSLVISLPNVQ
ncbi:hypothetical protein NUV89_14230 [Pseudomonas sp. 18.1.10]|uniref:hypothetical protein n=1 Tax=Pseudomonas sp. 18.1.10 TaxID=2969302 RepID=UPI00214FC442|nr:hypothetical protein [Pseudomonas sp. 18.1.10]MCR4539560.1 hypothetical protein [Pseudomonas sp. 18.1.10]